MDAASAAAVPPGGTIAQGAVAQAASAKAAGPAGSGHGAPKKVATAPGAAHYHEAIGALIIPHGHPHFVKGEPSHEVKGNISEAKWIANQWKGTTHEEAKEKAEKAVAEGTHHWVQAGEHSYAVHNGLETHIPKDTDIHDEAAVKHAPKVIVKPGEHPEHLALHPDHPSEPEPHGEAAAARPGDRIQEAAGRAVQEGGHLRREACRLGAARLAGSRGGPWGCPGRREDC